MHTAEGRRSRSINYIYLGNTQVASRTVAWAPVNTVTIRNQHTDALGSPVATTAPDTGAVLRRVSFTPWGETYGATTVDGVGYTGHVMDQATGLTYMQQRYYDPQIGKFLSTDPIQSNPNSGANFNSYWYANDNPYRFTDPDGRVAKGGGSNMGPQNWNANGDFTMSVAFCAPVGDDYSKAEVHTMDLIVGPGRFSGHGPTSNWNPSKASPMQKLYIAAFVAREYHLNIDGLGFKWIGEEREDAHARPWGVIEIGGGSFKSMSFLGQIIGHELFHWNQPNHGFGSTTEEGIFEAQAYRYNVESFRWFGSTKSEQAYFQARYNDYKRWEAYERP